MFRDLTLKRDMSDLQVNFAEKPQIIEKHGY